MNMNINRLEALKMLSGIAVCAALPKALIGITTTDSQNNSKYSDGGEWVNGKYYPPVKPGLYISYIEIDDSKNLKYAVIGKNSDIEKVECDNGEYILEPHCSIHEDWTYAADNVIPFESEEEAEFFAKKLHKHHTKYFECMMIEDMRKNSVLGLNQIKYYYKT